MSRRIRAEMTEERWFDVDEDACRRYFGGDVPDDLAAEVQQYVWDGDGFPSWLVERDSERDYRSDMNVYGVCAEHDRIMDTTFYGGEEPACGACWLRGYEASTARLNARKEH
jgi:hypothetical protein